MTGETEKKTPHQDTQDAQWVYSFGDGDAQGSSDMSELLGGKGANLAEMSRLGLPVPSGFTLTTQVCNFFYSHDQSYPQGLRGQVKNALGLVEKKTGMVFGDATNPLLLSVRSGARASMPGMMDTVLNLGMNDITVEALAKRTQDARFAYDSYRRFIQMYCDVVLGLEHHIFEDILNDVKRDINTTNDTDLTADNWQEVVQGYKKEIISTYGKPFPQDPQEQLWGAIGAVFLSWQTSRAQTYRKLHNIPHTWGTAVNVQAMVFGNMGNDSATGVAFTRDPSTGERAFYGEFLVNAQGEDVVAGIRTPLYLTKKARKQGQNSDTSMEESMPKMFKELVSIKEVLEKHYRDMQDFEFTVQQGKVWMLQTRNGKRTAKAALKIAVDMVKEGLISKHDAIARVNASSLDQLLHPSLDPEAKRHVLTKGLPASPGAVSGLVVFTANEAEKRGHAGQKVILVRSETSPEDIHGMHAAVGILTARGGMTSHAAVVARGMGRPCVSGAGALHINAEKKFFTIGETTVQEGDTITLDGSSGEVIQGRVPTVRVKLSGDFGILMQWADSIRRMEVRANAETPEEAKTAREFGAQGIGLCRTEHMFFDADRILAMREMILSENTQGRRKALAKLLPMQKKDFQSLFSTMAGLPITVRLLDPPLHEFLPRSAKEKKQVAELLHISLEKLESRLSSLYEFNPMLGHRGCRLGISYPEIYEIQVRALFEAAIEAAEHTKKPIVPEIMLPLISTQKEFEVLKEHVDDTAKTVMKEKNTTITYLVGTMIELPRAALKAGDIARHAQFFSFGTNDLTQTTFGISRDDSATFLETYLRKNILSQDPFITLDIDGVGELIKIAVERGRAANADIKLGICGEHGGDPASIAFCEKIGLDYISCSPYRVPIARLAAAQSALAKKTS